MCWIGLLKHKDETFDNFKVFKALVENKLYLKDKCLRYDRGGVFRSDEFFNFCEQHGIKRQFSIAKTHQENEMAERMKRKIQLMECVMIDESGIPHTFLGGKQHIQQ